jgi:2'-5' RNA ligase
MRLFTALPLPLALCNFVRECGAKIKIIYKGVRPVSNDDLHITLFFFGETSDQNYEILAKLMEDPSLRQSCFQITLGPLGQFPPRGRPRVLFFDIKEGREEVLHVFSLFRDLIARNGWPKQEEERSFKPHITVARNKFEQIQMERLSAINPLPGSFKIDRLVLFQSILKPAGAEYIPLKTVMFIT